MHTLLIDNIDSFTYNLRDLAHRAFGVEPVVVTNDADWSSLPIADFDAIIISPGPGRPQHSTDLGITQCAIAQTELPVLGVCLGHEAIAYAAGATVARAPQPMHGRTSRIRHNASGLFSGLPQDFTAVRYHSLCVTDLPPELEATAWSEDGVVMGLRHTQRPLWGVQFHPESALSECGLALMQNFFHLARAHTRQHQSQARPHPAPTATPAQTRALPPEPPHRLRVHWQQIDGEPDTQRLFSGLFAAADTSFWLDSSIRDPGTAAVSILGDATGPLAEVLRYDVNKKQWHIRNSTTERTVTADFYTFVKTQLSRRAIAPDRELPFDFTLGYVGALGYELKNDTTTSAAHRSPHPDAVFVFADRAIVVDHRSHSTYLLFLADDSLPDTYRAGVEWLQRTTKVIRSLLDKLPEPARTPEPRPRLEFTFDQDRTAYLDSIATCFEQIRDGESYEICLTNTATAGPLPDAYSAYLAMRHTSPVPFGAYLRFGTLALLSASPERFISINSARRVVAQPIKGTRRRGSSALDDATLRDDLARNAKDRAENLMIVDLLRNDLNRVCVPGSVAVDRIFAVETYSHVHQLVSTITGTLRAELSAVDCVQSAFPGGSMTGAPKVRTMEIIDSLEPRARGFYSGAIGWFSLSGAADLSIAIRTVVADATATSFGVGGAIVAQSDPDSEFTETLVKASALLDALGASIVTH